MIKYAVNLGAPVAVRYPRGEAYDGLKEYREPIVYGQSEWIYKESRIALFALGSMVKTAQIVRARLKEEGYECSLINARFAKPLDEETLLSLAKDHRLIVTLEENVITGGMGEHVIRFYQDRRITLPVLAVAIPDEYVEHGNVSILYREVGIDADTVTERVKQAWEQSAGSASEQ